MSMATMAAQSPESFTFTVGKLDAGMAILLGERAHLIEFPSVLLPPGATAGSIVNIAVHRNIAEEKRRDAEFWDLQRQIYETFGVDTPKAPELNLRNVTQTSVTLVWPPLHLATAKLRSLDIYRNGQRLAAIPQPLNNFSTKLSGLELDHEYTFQLILRTTAGTFPSNVIRVRTHTMTDTSGICVCFGTVQDKALLEEAKAALAEMRARWSDKIQIDTTHFVCTTPAAVASGANGELVSSGPGVEYQRALQLSIPVVQPQWILACRAQRKMVPIAQFYLGATSNTPLSSAPFQRPQSMSHVSLQRSPTRSTTSPTGTSGGAANRASMPPPRRSAGNADVDTATFVNQSPDHSPNKPPGSTGASPPTRIPEEDEDEVQLEGRRNSPLSLTSRRARNGTMDKNFRFPSPTADDPPPPLPNRSDAEVPHPGAGGGSVVTPEVPPPDPVEKEKDHVVHDADDDVGETEEISLN